MIRDMSLELPVAGSTPAPERGDAQRNRARVIEAAETLFCSSADIGRVDMREIAAEAGVGVGTLYRRFGDKATLRRQRPRSPVARAAGRDPRRAAAARARARRPRSASKRSSARLVDHTEAELGSSSRSRGCARARGFDDRPLSRLAPARDGAARADRRRLRPGWTAEALLAPLAPGLYAHQRRVRGLSPDGHQAPHGRARASRLRFARVSSARSDYPHHLADPDAVEGQRRLRARQQRGVLLVLRHRHQHVADPRGRARHPRRRGDRGLRRVALHSSTARSRSRRPSTRRCGSASSGARASATRSACSRRTARSPPRPAGSSTSSSTATRGAR